MRPRYSLRLTGLQHKTLERHLFPGDGLEAVALLVCGRREGDNHHIFTTRRVIPVPYEACDRSANRVTWSTDLVDSILKSEYGRRQAIIRVHSHPQQYPKFSEIDDESDRRLFESVSNFQDDGLPHASAIMLPNGLLIVRTVTNGKPGEELSSVSVVGDDLRIWSSSATSTGIPSHAVRQAQVFGQRTTNLLRELSAAVIGCSGTGSIVVEQLARLGIGKLVLIDPETVEDKNLNRVLNSGKEDAYLSRFKVHVLASAIARMGFAQEVLPIPENLASKSAILAAAECDVLFGCMDGSEGRHLLNRLATFYCLPYFDVGVRLQADGSGGVAAVAGAVHYLQPGRSSLLSRGVYSMAQVEAEEMRRVNPELYRRQLGEGYITGVLEDRPAVITINTFFASLMVNEFLARLHPYRNRPNSDFAYVGGNLAEGVLLTESEQTPCATLGKHVGRGDVEPLIDRPMLS
jgi:hypothetical protein